jgi:uncharacterized delta-60 repeat protein
VRRVVVAPIVAAVAFAILATGVGAGMTGPPGDLDPSFSGDGKATTDLGDEDDGAGVAVQQDGKLVVAGTTNDLEATGVARYNPDGGLDAGFGDNGIAITAPAGTTIRANDVALQPDGKIVVGGFYETGGPAGTDFMAARYESDGDLDPTFGDAGIATIDLGTPNDFASAVALQPGGEIVLAGDAEGSGSDLGVARLDDHGDPDGSFSGDGWETLDLGAEEFGSDIGIQDDGRIVVAGSTGADQFDADFALVRFLPEGGPDDTFSDDGVETTNFDGGDFADGLAIQPDGKLVAAGVADNAENADFALARYTIRGELDSSFSQDGKQTTDFGGFRDSASDVALENDGDVVAVGQTATDDTGDSRDFALARYKGDGELDPAFSGDGRQTTGFDNDNNSASAVAIQDDDRIVAAGSSEQPSTGNDFAVARYLGDTEPTPAGGHCGGLDATIIGTDDGDELTGTVGNDVIDAGKGPDQIGGLAGDDLICGGKGADEIKGTNGNDDLRGGSGADGIRGGKGRDKASGSKGRDTIRGAKGRDKMKGGPGGDFIRGGKSRDKLRGGSGFDNCKGGPGKDRLKGC